MDRYNAMGLDELFAALVDETALAALIEAVRRVDLGERGDVTSTVCIDAAASTRAVMVARASGVLAGVVLLRRIAAAYDGRLLVTVERRDGEAVQRGDVIATIDGTMRSVLAAERVMLNFMTHLSGIATATAAYARAIEGTAARVYDTRKTAPGLRTLAKYAVRCGGGYCHRIGLHDAVLIKDNHVSRMDDEDFGAALRRAASAARAIEPPVEFIEVEVDTMDQFRAVLGADVELVLLDNMTLDELREAVQRRDAVQPALLLEASGGVTLETIRAVAETGVDRIAVGAITHSAAALDIGLDIA